MAYELVQDITVSSATTSVSFTGLNFTSADDLLLVSDVVNPTTSGSYFLYVNGNTTPSNYYCQYLLGDSTTIASGRVNQSIIGTANTSARSSSFTNIKLTNSGYFVWQTKHNSLYGSSSQWLVNYFNTSTFTLPSITSLSFSAQFSNGIGIGSRFRLYKLVAEKVADITVSTATTSVDITGLSIDKGSEYMLVSDVVNGNSTTTADINIGANGNNTSTNYYVQNMFAEATLVSSSRVNSNTLMNVSAYLFPNYKYSLSIANLKLTNNGNFVWQSNVNAFYKSDLASLHVRNGTSTFTTSSITQLTISAGAANAIGVGSRFQLYKLR